MTKQVTDTTNFFRKWGQIIALGIFSGIFWGGLLSLASVFSFTRISPYTLSERLFVSVVDTPLLAHLLGIGMFTIISVIFTILYDLIFRFKEGVKGPICVGILLFISLFVIAPSYIDLLPNIIWYGSETFVTLFCFFIIYTSFIGISISYGRLMYGKSNK